jgi:hypothetical protein
MPVRPLLLSLLLSGLLTVPAEAKPLPRAPAGWLGVMADGPMLDPAGAPKGEWDRLRASGAQTVRMAFYWDDLEPAQGTFDFASTDRLVGAATARKLRIIPTLIRAPAWARDGERNYPPTDANAIRGVSDALVRRYGPQGSFWAERTDLPRRPIRVWQVWNEPGIPFYWAWQPFAESYVPVLRVAAGAIRAADPGAKVVLAGLNNESWTDLRKIYEAGGRGAFDVVALHPYTRIPKDSVRIVKLNRKVMREFGDAALPVWVTEITYAAIDQDKVYAEPTWSTTPEGQAGLLRAVLRRFAMARRKLKIERVLWYSWLSGYERDDWTDWTGLRRTRGDRTVGTLALKAFKRSARELQRP